MVDLNNTDMQFQYIKMMCGDKQSFIKAKKLFIPEFFGTEVQNTAKFVKDYYDKHGDLPSSDIIKASVGIDLGEVSPLKSDQREWLLENFESFIKVSGMRHAVMEASKYTVDNPERIIDIIQRASKLNLERDFGLDYQSDPKQRLENIRLRSGNVSNGYDSIDIVAGKANYGDLFIVAGSSGTGKSLLLQNIAINYYQEGKNVIYITLELHPELCARRMDAMNLNIDTSELYNRLDLYSDKIKKQKDTGKLTLKYMPSGTKTSEIKSLIEDYMMETGVKLDAIIVDYLDLVDPNSNNVKAGDTFAKDKYVSEELRNMSQDLGIVCFTASQLNRDAVQQEELHHGHIAGGMSKINTADLVLGIISSNMHREKGIYELQILKNRNGTGTGKKVRLSIDANTMRISDDEEFLADIEIYQQAGKATLSPTEKMMNKVQNALNGDNKEYQAIDEETGEKLIDQTVGAEQSTSDTTTIEIGKPSQTGTYVKAQLPPEVRSQAAASKLAGLDSLLGDDDDDDY